MLLTPIKKNCQAKSADSTEETTAVKISMAEAADCRVRALVLALTAATDGSSRDKEAVLCLLGWAWV